MAPPKHKLLQSLSIRNVVTTRSRAVTTTLNKDIRFKRKAESSPSKENTQKRLALGDVTNAGPKKVLDDKSKPVFKNSTIKKVKQLPPIKTIIKPKNNENLIPPPAPGCKLKCRPVKEVVPNETAIKPKEQIKEHTNKIKTRLSNEFEKTEESLYSTALEDIYDSNSNSAKGPQTRSKCDSPMDENKPTNITLVALQMEHQLNLGCHDVPDGIDDFDKENWNDIYQASHYAMDIFNYLKEREQLTVISDYMERQVCLTNWMRSLLVDWMVEIQESFELNHETLYLGVKLVDLYLSRMTVGKETLQLVGASAMFVASKYDERIPPLIDDFLYICDGAYSRRELIRMEMNLLKVCNFDLGISISYRFLRRYARCAKINMPVLTLARFILESSLMNYTTVAVLDSKLAAASLYLALQMKKVSGWTRTLEFYTGYTLPELHSTIILLNNDLHVKPKPQLMTIRNKYSHKIFFEVAKIPLINNEDLKS